jgi:hypothetical protein
MTRAEKAALAERVAGYKRLNEDHFYMVTFDLRGAVGREALYRKFGTHLKELVGRENAHRLIKQCYFVRSSFLPRDIRTEMQQLLSGRDSILVARLAPGASYRVTQPGAGPAARHFFRELEETHDGL